MAQASVAITEDGLNKILNRLRERSDFEIERGDWVGIGPMRLRLAGARGHLENGSFRVINPPAGLRGQIKEIDIVWDRLDVDVGLDIPTTCVGGFCVVPNPFGGCWVRAPRKCFFRSDPDIFGRIPLGGLRNEISAAFDLSAKHPSGKWEVYLEPEMPIDVDFIDASDMVAEILDRVVDVLVDDLLGFLPGWARDLVKAILGSLVGLIRGLLDLADDVMEWISEKIGLSLGFFNIVISLILEFFFEPEPIYEFEDPYTLLESEPGLPAVLAAITDLDAGFATSPDRIEFGIALEEV